MSLREPSRPGDPLPAGKPTALPRHSVGLSTLQHFSRSVSYPFATLRISCVESSGCLRAYSYTNLKDRRADGIRAPRQRAATFTRSTAAGSGGSSAEAAGGGQRARNAACEMLPPGKVGASLAGRLW